MNKKNLIIGIFVSLSLILAGGYTVVDRDKTYYCESRDLVGVCEKLSSGSGTRCYYNETYRVCKEGWEKLNGFIELEKKEYSGQLYGGGGGSGYLGR